MLAGIYYGAQYGDSVSAITMKIPHASSIVACIDGYQMTLKGKTGLALFTAGVSSFIGGTVAIVVLSFFAPTLGEVALPVRPRRLLRADAGRLRLRELRHHRQPAQRPGHVPDRRAARADRHRRQQRHAALHHGPAVPDRRHRPGQHRAGLLRHRRDHEEPRQPRRAHAVQRQDQADADLAGVQAHHPERAARQRDRLVPRHPARRRPGDRPVRRLRGRQEGQQVQGRDRHRRDRGRGRAGRRRRSGGAHQLHPADEHRHSRERGDGADDGRLHHQGHPARART